MVLSSIFLSQLALANPMMDSLGQSKVEPVASPYEKENGDYNGVEPITLYNFSTKTKETIKNPFVITEDKAREFIPPVPLAMDVFDQFIASGKTPYISLFTSYKILESEINKKENE